MLETINHEVRLIKENYWRYSPAGLPLPGFLKSFPIPSLMEISKDKAEYFYFALECEHRWQPIISEEALRCAIERIRYRNYDWTEAVELRTNYIAAYEIITSKVTDNDEAMEIARDSVNYENVSSFPKGREANMQMIKALLGKQT